MSDQSIKPISLDELKGAIEKENPVPKEETPDSYLHEVLQNAEKVSDQIFEEAKAIILDAQDSAIIDSTDNFSLEEESNFETVIETPVVEQRATTRNVPRIEDEPEGTVDSNDEVIQRMKEKIKEKVKPILNTIDLSSFTVGQPMSVHSILEATEATDFIADHPLLNTGICISMKEFTGYDITKLDPRNSQRNAQNAIRDVYKLIYDHVVNENKPSFEEFLKLIRYDDVSHLYWAIYKSSFNKTNDLPYECTDESCGEVFVENISIESMEKFKNDDVRAEFNAILNSGDSNFKLKDTVSLRQQISDDYVVDLRLPSIFNAVIEVIALSEEFRNAHTEMISILTFIDTIYYIDRVNHTLVPVKYKVDEKNLPLTVKNRTLAYAKIIQSLSSDQYYFLSTLISGLSKDSDGVSYVIPEAKCPKCGKSIPEAPADPQSVLFTRHQLIAITGS